MTQLFGSEFAESYTGWEAKQNDQGAIYYVNNELRVTSWTHPYVNQILDKLDKSFGLIKYAAYRTSLKLRKLQIQTGMVWINVKAVHQVMLSTAEESFEDGISHSHALYLIDKILQLSEGCQEHEEEIPVASEIILNFIVNLYDLDHCGKVSYGSLAIALTALCSAKIMDKYKNFFACLKDKQNRMRKSELSKLILDLTQITDIIHESEAFGSNVRAAVTSCFRFAGAHTADWISEHRFYSWLLQEPQTLIWLPTLHRVQATETIVHDIRCCVCSEMPIIGFRYRCLYCFRYDQCQNCFLKGLTSHSHKLRHPMTEYCLPTSAKDNTLAILNILKNKLRGNQSQPKPSYLPVDEDSFNSSNNHDEQPGNVQQACNSQSSDSGLANGSDVCQGLSLSDNGIGFCNHGFEESRVEDETDIVKTSSQLSISSSQEDSASELVNKMADRILTLEQENRKLHKKLKCLQTKFELDSAFYEDYLDNTSMADDGKSLENVAQSLTEPQISSTPSDYSSVGMSESTSSQDTDKTVSTEQSSAAEVTNETQHLSVAAHRKCSQSETEVSNGLLYQTCDMSLDTEEAKMKNNTQGPRAEQSVEILITSDSSKCVTPFKIQSSSCEIHFVKETRPHLIYSSVSSKARGRRRSGVKSENIRDKENTPYTEKPTSPEDASIELSNIYPASFGVTPSFSHHRNLNSVVQCTPGQPEGRKHAMEPVYMSTPVVPPHLAQTAGQSAIQENRALQIRKQLQCTNVSPLSAIPHWHRKRILLSCNSFSQGNGSFSQTCDSTGQFTKLLEKADKIGDMINQGQTFLTTEDQDCYEKMLQEFEKECLLDLTSNKFKMDPDDAEMLQAVFTIEEAMKDLVQATGHHAVH